MKITFASEDRRKTNLFAAWIEFLIHIHGELSSEEFDEIYEGIAQVIRVSKNRMTLKLVDGRILRYVHIPPSVSEHSRPLDHVLMAIGRRGPTWTPIEVFSVASPVFGKQMGVHMTVNPLYANAVAPVDESKAVSH